MQRRETLLFLSEKAEKSEFSAFLCVCEEKMEYIGCRQRSKGMVYHNKRIRTKEDENETETDKKIYNR